MWKKAIAAVRGLAKPAITPPDQRFDSPDVAAVVRELTRLTRPNGHPNINELWAGLKDIEVLRMNTKNFGFELAKQAAATVLAAVDYTQEPRRHGLVSKPTTQADIESPWFSYWCSQLKAAPLYHRKLWEFAFLLQVLFEHDLLRPGTRGLGFGCGNEPLASYFASRKMHALITDLAPEEVAGRGWAETGQHASSREAAFLPDIVSRELFDRHVEHRFVDMNAIPSFSQPFDFCWSICSLEHLGSIQKGLDFILNSLATLKPGGLAIHTTEYNYLSTQDTLDNWPTVLFLRQHFEALKMRLEEEGHQLLGPDFDVGSGVLDRFIDVPPYGVGQGLLSMSPWGGTDQAGHLKLAIDGFACTCFGLIVRRSSSK